MRAMKNTLVHMVNGLHRLEQLLQRMINKQEQKQMKKTEQCYTNREHSWLQFNERVLNEAGNPRVPLAERLTFASYFSFNCS